MPTWETVRSLLLALGYAPDLEARRLAGRWDPLHLAGVQSRAPVERLAMALSANRLAARLREAGRVAQQRA
jgi:hypothetical protein